MQGEDGKCRGHNFTRGPCVWRSPRGRLSARRLRAHLAVPGNARRQIRITMDSAPRPAVSNIRSECATVRSAAKSSSRFAEWTSTASTIGLPICWFTRRLPIADEYVQARVQIKNIVAKIERHPCYQPGGTTIIATGHSLGGGLASGLWRRRPARCSFCRSQHPRTVRLRAARRRPRGRSCKQRRF